MRSATNLYGKDWLLAAAQILIVAAKALLSIVLLGIGVGAVYILSGQDDIAAALTAGQSGVALVWANAGIILFLLGLIGLVGIGFMFVALLGRIVNSVGAGDPFILVNAQRLSRMAWLVLGAQILSLALDLLGAWLSSLFPSGFGGENWHFSLDGDTYLSPEGILLALTLFILARVFRAGAEMRADLEGTV